MPHELVNGIRIHYKEFGQGFPIVLVHGYTGNLVAWVFQIPVLGQRYRTVSLDLRGHGLTDRPSRAEDYSLGQLADDVYGLLQALGISECYLCGHSMGGMVAQEFILAHPEMVRALILVDTTAEQPTGAELGDGGRLLQMAQEQGMEAVFEEMLRTTPLFDTLATMGSVFIEKVREQFLLTSVEGYVYCAQAIHVRRPLLDELYRIQVPTLIICGALDETFPGAAPRMHERIAGSELAIIPHSGHNPLIEQPQEFNRIVVSFLERADAGLAGR
jgi:2-succinyl-6-hydroxy-2,4-cyclohexadiene-1-carboxylate synthase